MNSEQIRKERLLAREKLLAERDKLASKIKTLSSENKEAITKEVEMTQNETPEKLKPEKVKKRPVEQPDEDVEPPKKKKKNKKGKKSKKKITHEDLPLQNPEKISKVEFLKSHKFMVYFKNTPYSLTDEEVKDFFKACGKFSRTVFSFLLPISLNLISTDKLITHCEGPVEGVHRVHNNGRFLGIGYVAFTTHASLDNALALNGTKCGDRTISIFSFCFLFLNFEIMRLILETYFKTVVAFIFTLSFSLRKFSFSNPTFSCINN